MCGPTAANGLLLSGKILELMSALANTDTGQAPFADCICTHLCALRMQRTVQYASSSCFDAPCQKGISACADMMNAINSRAETRTINCTFAIIPTVVPKVLIEKQQPGTIRKGTSNKKPVNP